MELSKTVKSEIRKKVTWTPTGDPCLRCGHEGHDTKHCDAPIDTCWKDTTIFTDATEAEELYQSERKKLEDKKAKNSTKKVANEAATAKKTPHPTFQTKQPASTVQYSTMPVSTEPPSKFDQASNKGNDSTEATKEVRAPIPDKNVGKIDRLANTETPGHNDPRGANVGLYQGATDDIGGITGQNPAVRTNYVRVNAIPKQLFAYSLRFYRERKDNEEDVEINKQGEIKSAFDAFMQSSKLNLGNVVWATDYKELWCTSKLPIQDGATFQDIAWDCPGGRIIEDLKLDIGSPKCMDILGPFKTKATCDLSDEIRALNAIISRAIHKLCTDLIQVGANKFFIKGAFSTIAGGLRAQRGYFTSIRPSVSGPLLNINTATGVFLPPMLVSDFLNQCTSDHKLRDLTDVLSYVERMLKNCTVRIIYRRQNYEGGKDMNTEHSRLKTFRHFGATAGKQKFYNVIRDEEGKKVADPEDNGKSVYQWYNQEIKLDVKIAAETLCVNVGTPASSLTNDHKAQCAKGAIWIPATLLEIVPDQSTNVGLCPHHTAEMIRIALRAPGHNAGLIDLEGLEKLGIKGTQGHLKDMNVSTGRNMIKFGAKKTTQPQIVYGQEKLVTSLKNAAWNLTNVKFANAKSVGALHVLMCRSALGARGNEQVFLGEMTAQLKTLGIDVGKERSYAEELRETSLYRRLPNWFPDTKAGDCTIVVLGRKSEDEYAAVKRAGDITFGRHTLCLLGDKIKHDVGHPDKFSYMQHLANLALKVNLKMGGDNHHVNIHGLGSLKAKTIILGADVTHPGNDSTGRPSIAAVVGSIDDHFMNYPGSMRLQAGGQEAIEDMDSMVKERLTAWATSHSGILPENMVFYRDGISESQFHECERGEIAAIRTAYASLCVGKNENARLKLTFVVVGKRHNTRFYPTNTSDCTKYEKYDEKKSNMNVAPGLLVDRVITDPKRVNFYLQSHQAIKGTARAAHYHVLVDDIGFKENNKAVGSLSDLTHQLCYAFSRATRGVSYVAPAYIADRLCERGRVYLRDWSGEGLPEFKTGGKKGKSTVEELKKWKDVCAKKAMRDVRFQGGTEKLWGHYNDDATKGVVRLNPWHPEMDRVMFWM